MTDMFDNRKIKQIEQLPDGDSIIVIWVKLLCLAGNVNECGFVFFTKEIPYTDEMMATEFNRPVSTIRLALQTFQRFGMVEIINDVIKISNWENYQNVDGMDKLREQTRKRVAKYREKQKHLLEDKGQKDSNVTCSVTVTECNAIEEDKEEDIERDKEEDIEKEKNIINYQKIVDMYNDTCVSFPRVKSLSEARRKAIRARLKTYSVDDLQRVFEKAEASNFLKGANGRNWNATFDWLLKDSNIAKVLDGNYDNVRTPAAGAQAAGNRIARQLDESYNMIAEWAESEG
jgi:predicted phage replisome organizer